MAHGTGRYLNRKYSADLQTDEYVAIFFQTYDYYYPQMSDSYEPDCEAENDFTIEIIKWRPDPRFPESLGRKIADHISESIKISGIDKDEANKIWWNIKNNNVSYESVAAYFRYLEDKRKSA